MKYHHVIKPDFLSSSAKPTSLKHKMFILDPF